MNTAKLFDIEFSLSIYNRTGKYFIGKDIIESCAGLLGDTYYWYYSSDNPPPGLLGKAIGRLQHLQVTDSATGGPFRLLPKRTPSRPLLHIDPFSVLSTHLSATDAVICHDIGPITHPHLFDPKTEAIYDKIYQQIADIGPHVIFVSNATQRAFHSAYPRSSLATQRVIYPAIRADFLEAATSPLPAAGSAFLLMAGALGVRKNQIGAVRAFAHSGLAERGVKLVLCGSKEPGYEAVQKTARATQGVVLLSYVSDAELRWLYENARGFVLPSFLEGFGMPVAEAIKYELIPLVSADSVLEEVAGDAALSVAADDETAIAQGMIRLVDMPQAERATRCRALKGSVGRFSAETIKSQWRAALAQMAEINATPSLKFASKDTDRSSALAPVGNNAR